MTNGEIYDVIKYVYDELKIKDSADGCVGCAFNDTEEWEMPCAKCKRNMKDYWRAKVVV